MMVDDFSDTIETTGVLSTANPANGTIEIPNDEDWFAVTLTAGHTYQFDLEGSPTNAGTLSDTYLRGLYDANGNFITGTTNDDGGTGYNSRLDYTANTTGTYYISAGAFGNNTGTYRLSLNDQTTSEPSGSNNTFDIDINYTGDATYQDVFDRAVARWEQIIIADLPNVGNIDDLQISASIIDIDGVNGIVGQASPNLLREGSNLPYSGVMEFDSADIANMFADGTLEAVILHEMGHVLGIGTLWDQFFPNNNPLTGEYRGTNALREYQQLGGTRDYVPVDINGGPGTAGGHWDTDVLGTELLTGYIENSGVSMPISKITVGVLDDLGYTVNYAAADDFILPLTNTSSALKVSGIILNNDLLLIA